MKETNPSHSLLVSKSHTTLFCISTVVLGSGTKTRNAGNIKRQAKHQWGGKQSKYFRLITFHFNLDFFSEMSVVQLKGCQAEMLTVPLSIDTDWPALYSQHFLLLVQYLQYFAFWFSLEPAAYLVPDSLNSSWLTWPCHCFLQSRNNGMSKGTVNISLPLHYFSEKGSNYFQSLVTQCWNMIEITVTTLVEMSL